MILSEKYEFVFIKGLKVAGTSVEMALSTLCGEGDIVTPISLVDEQARIKAGGHCRNYSDHPDLERQYIRQLDVGNIDLISRIDLPPVKYYNHMSLMEVAEKYGASVFGYKILFVERSPYSKVISWANMKLTYGQYLVGGEMRADIHKLRAFVDRGIENNSISSVRNIDRYRKPDGAISTQHFRYERLQLDFDAFARTLKVSNIPQLPHAKRGLMSNRLDPTSIFRKDQIRRINDIFAEEFQAFGYNPL